MTQWMGKTARVVILVALLGRPACCQVEAARSVPTAAYYSAIATYNNGDYRRAFDAFRAAGRLGLRFGNDRWADAICYHAMMGECLLQVGEPARALEEFNQALTVFLLNRDWLRRVDFPPAIAPANVSPRTNVTWGTRPTMVGDFQRNMQVLFGNPNVQEVVQRGGVFAPPEIRSVNVSEIVRCTGLALRRRAELLGPICRTDPMSSQLVVALESRIGIANHWSEAWLECLRGMALLGMGKQAEAADILQRSLLIAGQFDHPLTAQALLQLASIAETQGNYGQALDIYLQASIAAARFEQQDAVAEALHRAAATHWIAGGQGIYGPLIPAAAWAKRQQYAQLLASLLVDIAEQQIAGGDYTAAEAALTDARQLTGRRQLASASVNARLAFQTAAAHYHNNRDEQAATVLGQAIEVQQRISTWLFQISALDAMYRANAPNLTERDATVLYEQLLREPSEGDWLSDPLDTLAVKSVDKGAAFESWFELSMRRGETARSIEIAERMRRQRFLSRLPLAGRTLALRWLLEAPLEMLSERAGQRRQDLTARFPELGELSRALEATRREAAFRVDHLLDQDAEDAASQKARVKRLITAATNYERALCQIAVRRVDAPESFPPLRSLQQIQDSLKDEQLVLSFVVTSKSVYAMMISNRNQAVWKIESTVRTRQGVAALLREFGMAGDSSTMNEKRLLSEKWKVVSKALLDHLIDSPQMGFWKKFEELIVVPENFLWYLPFESLLVDTEASEAQPLINVMRVRYAPTIGLAVVSPTTLRRDPVTAVVLGQLFPRDDVEIAKEQFAEIAALVPGLSPLPDKLPGPSGVLRCYWDRLVVLDDLSNSSDDPFGWAPASLDQGTPQTSLMRWMELPWGGPVEVYLPGFHSAAETGMKKTADGEEIELAVLGLMASGARTVLISRWRTGGQTAYNLMREFLQERPQLSSCEAWQRAVQVTRGTTIDPTWEPRVSVGKDAEATLTADHPFFWSGYLLCDQAVREPTADSTIEGSSNPDEMRPAAEDPSNRAAGVP